MSQVFRFLLIYLLISVSVSAAPDWGALAREYGPRLERILRENILAFWLPRCLDRERGGYIINFDRQGREIPGGVKMIVTQARMVWLFSRLARAGYCGKECLDAAEHGYRFLRDRMWDAENGGFYWEVDITGSQKLRPHKHLYGQAFALYAVSEYALASGNPSVKEFAAGFFNLLDSKAHDPIYGGYREFFNRDWSAPPAGVNSYMSAGAAEKLMNTHLHLMEALTTLYRAAPTPLARERLIELIAIESSAVVRKDLGACTDKYARDWTPLLGSDFARVSYGHDVENVWLLIDACNAAGLSNYPLHDLYRAMFAYSQKYGFDTQAGGFFDSGPFNQPADRRNKVWWVQAEGLVSALYMYRETGDSSYLEVFRKTLDFIERRQVDWEFGEWFDSVHAEGVLRPAKAHAWKAGYHNGRAMIECLEILKGR
jgi:mannobiose 2-epimerase